MTGITIFEDVILPHSVVLAAGLTGKQIRNNSRVSVQGGAMKINIVWDQTLREFEFGIRPMSPELWRTFEGLFEVTEGGAYGFLMADPKDSTVALGDGFLQPLDSNGLFVGTVGFGYGVPSYAFARVYTALTSTRTKSRKVSRPAAGAVFTRAAVTPTVGTGPGEATVTSGVVTFGADFTSYVDSVVVGSTTALTFSPGSDIVANAGPGDRLWVTDLYEATVSPQGTINGMSHVVTDVTGDVVTIDFNSTGGDIYGGNVALYPQSSEAMEWSGAFYVPVHFKNDYIDWDLMRPDGNEASRLVMGPGFVLSEVRE